MRLVSVECNGCGRIPTVWEWIRAEMTQEGYGDWHHPGIDFRAAGYPITHDSQPRSRRLFEALFGRPLPQEMTYLCPQCQARVEAELPALGQADADFAETTQELELDLPAEERPPVHRIYLGRTLE